MENYPFIKCCNPQKIVNPHTKEPLVVGCGKCEACLNQKSSIRALKCKLETLSHKYCYFITLTYSNEYVPLMCPYRCKNSNSADALYYMIDSTPRNKGYGEEILSEARFSVSQIDMLQKKCNLDGFIPVLNVVDLQLFMKRLRKYISKYSDEKLRYYAMGEYGPVHFRPHYHLMLWFSDGEIQKVIQQAVSTCWSYGRVDCSLSQGQCASYVAGYLNGSSNLPRVFKTGKAKPFACHSRFLGESILQSQKKEVYSLSPDEFVKRSFSFDGSNTEFSVWRSFTNYYYPKCPRYSTSTHLERYRSYRTYAEASEITKEASPWKQANKIMELLTSKHNFRYVPLLDYFSKVYSISEHIGRTDYIRKTRQVYVELLTSYRFLHVVCNSDNYVEQDTKLTMIERFYDSLDLMNLGKQLTDIDEYSKHDAVELDELNFFYYNKQFDKEKFMNLSIVKQFRENQITRYSDSVKHKHLNDANKIFNY